MHIHYLSYYSLLHDVFMWHSFLGISQLVSVLQDGAAVTGLAIAAASLVAVNTTGNAIYDPIGSIIVGNLLGMVCDLSLKELECSINVSKIFLTSMI